MKRFIFKIDDYRFNEAAKFKRLFDICQRQGVPMSIGAIGAPLNGGRLHHQQAFAERCRSGAIEVWNHSLTHRNLTQLDDIDVAWEIAATNAACERQLGLTPEGFGAPFNKCDERVTRIARELGMRYVYEEAFPLSSIVTPEFNAPLDGQPNFTEFKKRVEQRASIELLLVQVHPGRWLSRGFEQIERCLAWLQEAGYQPTTARQALGLEGSELDRPHVVRGHELVVSRLAAHWQEHATEYEARLSNFSSYFLARFKANSLDIRKLIEALDADLGFKSVVDVGCGLAQWGLPFFEFESLAHLWAFETSKPLADALADARDARLFPFDVYVMNEDFVTSTSVPGESVDAIVCANALNYIPLVGFVRQALRICKEGALVILLNQTEAFNHLGVRDALSAGNLGMASERGMAALRQELVRVGFAGFMPARATPDRSQLEAVFYAFGFQLSDDFLPAWERTFDGRPTFEGLVFSRRCWIEPQALPVAFRPTYRKLLCRGGFSELDSSLFANDAGDLDDLELLRLKARAGAEKLEVEGTSIDFELGSLARQGAFGRLAGQVLGSAIDDPELLLAGAVAAFIDKQLTTAKELARRFHEQQPAGTIADLLGVMCEVEGGDAKSALGRLGC